MDTSIQYIIFGSISLLKYHTTDKHEYLYPTYYIWEYQQISMNTSIQYIIFGSTSLLKYHTTNKYEYLYVTYNIWEY